MKYIYQLFAIVLFSASCQHFGKKSQTTGLIKYNQDPSISNNQGKPVDSTVPFIPSAFIYERYWVVPLPNKDKMYIRKCETSREEIIANYEYGQSAISDTVLPDTADHSYASIVLYKMGEPTLSNFYLGKTVYRLTSFGGSQGSISIVNDQRDYYVQIKILHHPAESWLTENHYIDKEGRDSIIPFIPQPNFLILNKKIKINASDFRKIRSLIESNSFLALPPYLGQCNIGYDEGDILLEVANRNGYKFIDRSFSQCEPIIRKIIGEFQKCRNLGIVSFNFCYTIFRYSL